ncbi:conserved hypothetical protein [Candida dubliniensis CD36]|uniref:Uncharacterized protein n=1 Tax=Candida dubliniensis (strain CD36 / ATCC MYA-646 / CBS 7987 / NCPF 3949 / NRRL Y-17841) TaxID=573826 RepID=B9WKS9_CANDC|nr:conserved hypothetical protein [Candida dubliniensis CD36]CAX39629.1 conserved hypothetical protein [Candida dubliniensis CD36]
MATFITTLDEEINYIQDLLQSIPFSSDRTTHFLKVYKISHQELMKLNEQPLKFPVEANKLLKLSISLGNLIRTLQIDEESYQQQHNQQRQFLQNLSNAKNGGTNSGNNSNNGTRVSSTISDPFRDSAILQPPPLKHVINSNNNSNTNFMSPNVSQPPYQTRFIKNLVSILKNFDIGSRNDIVQSSTTLNGTTMMTTTTTTNRDSVSSNQSIFYTPQRVLSNGSNTSSANMSPIKLNSKQLLIEKLEININLDNLFIYKITLKLILEIFHILKQNLINTTSKLNDPSFAMTPTKYDFDESSSIFSSNSSNSQDSTLTNDEYYKFLSVVISRISHGIIQPFVILIYREFVETKISDDFTQLINSL